MSVRLTGPIADIIVADIRVSVEELSCLFKNRRARHEIAR